VRSEWRDVRFFGTRSERRTDPPFLLAAVVLGALAASRFFALAAEPGEIDEAVFAGAVTRYDLFDLSPQAPGFPLWILIGRLLLPVCLTPFNALATASTVLSALALPALYIWGRRLVGGWSALGGTLFAGALPVVWVNGGRGFSDTPATALFLMALACLALTEERRETLHSRWGEYVAARRARRFAAAAGLLAAAGAGVRPHLVLAFGPLLLLWAFRTFSRAHRRAAAVTFVGSAAAGGLAWNAWLWAQAGGVLGLFSSLAERAEFRAHAFSTGTFGTLADSFAVRDLLTPARAAVFWVLLLGGLTALARRRAESAVDLAVVLVPLFVSLWFLHSRAMSRYSVPLVMVASLPVVYGASRALRKAPLGFLAAALAAVPFAAEAWPEVLWSAREGTPAMAAIRALERYVHPGRETIIADGVFHAFLRTERWERRLVAWAYTDAELVSAALQMNKRVVRLTDFTPEPQLPPSSWGWSLFSHGGRAAEELGNKRLLTVGLRDPAPPLFGPGFGVREEAPGQPSFRWSGPSAILIVPGDHGPPAAFLAGERPGDAGPTVLRVTEAATKRVLVTRTIEPGPFELAIIPTPVFGPLEGPRLYTISCDRPRPLPPFSSTRPLQGCFTFREAAISFPPDALWDRLGARYLAFIGSPRDEHVDPDGFFARERVDALAINMRWSGARSSVVWVPVSGFRPRRLSLRAHAPNGTPVDVAVLVAGENAGTLRVRGGEFAETGLDVPETVSAALSGAEPVRIELQCPTWSPSRAGASADPRELGVAVDRIALD
jgi:4-amino-4-deoxy-L-arabinose transferase-like glycosyltransferase